MASSSSSSSQEEASDYMPVINCPHCHAELGLRQSASVKNPGKYYYNCNKVQEGYAGGCSNASGFFSWADEVTGRNGDGTPIMKLKTQPMKRQRVSAGPPRQEAHVGSSSEFMPPGQAAVILKKMEELDAKMTFLITLLQDKRS